MKNTPSLKISLPLKLAIFSCLYLAILPTSSLADSVGRCGWGSKLFAEQRGIAPQVLAVTTNGSSGSQTFGITFGTSGCRQDGVVKSSWKTAAFINDNVNKLAKDVAHGQGETLETLASLLSVEKADKEIFNSSLKKNFSKLFPTEDTSAEDVYFSLKTVLEDSQALSKYSVVL